MILEAVFASRDRLRSLPDAHLAEEVAAARRHLANLSGRVGDEDADALQRVCHLIMELRHRADLPVVPVSVLIRSTTTSAVRAED